MIILKKSCDHIILCFGIIAQRPLSRKTRTTIDSFTIYGMIPPFLTAPGAFKIVLASSKETNMKWYIIHTTPGYENKVRERLEARIKENAMSESFGEILVPSEEIADLKNGKKVITTRRLYPGYVFLNMQFSDRVWHLVRKTPNVTGFVGGNNQPAPMKDSEVQAIRNRQSQSHDKPAPKVAFAKGETIRVSAGPFKDFNGTIDHIDYDKGKLRLMVAVFGRETSLEISFSEVEKTT
jgi:transcriptional antiterminator NusG